MEIAGRQEEVALLQSLLEKRKSSFVAVYGRRRIGKTYLIRQVYKENMVFEYSGLQNGEMSQQLEGFWIALNEANPKGQLVPPSTTWLQAFLQLKNYLNTLTDDRKKVVFIDEIPWIETPRSGFLAAEIGRAHV